jgi:hypothetical protein
LKSAALLRGGYVCVGLIDLLILGSERLRDKVELELSRVLVGQVSFWFPQLTLQG